MTTPSRHAEPSAAASPRERRQFVAVAGLFLAGPVIWATHFMGVYLLAEALCASGSEAELLGLPAISTLTLAATAVAVLVTGAGARLAYVRWRASAIGWDGSTAAGDAGPSGDEQHGGLALGGFLLGALSVVAILFTGLPAVVLAC